MDHYEKVRDEVKLASGDYIDLKMYEPAMRHLIDTYIRAEESEKVSAFDDMSLVQLIVERGADAVEALPEGIRKNKEAVAETIENNVRKLIIDEQPINPKYYEKMSELLDALIEQRKQEALDYQEYLEKIVELTQEGEEPGCRRQSYPEGDEHAGQAGAVRQSWQGRGAGPRRWIRRCGQARQDDWRATSIASSRSRRCEAVPIKSLRWQERRRSRLAEEVLELVKNQNEY